ncbi:MAG TPA: methionyl-tRNA formyltransferase [Candidatus Binataceae bacterium]|nr:methionyl-tRNA formyltransferase [Candidatus Binataceae bacterium]
MASRPPAPASDPPYNIVFMGTPELAARILEVMLQQHHPGWRVVGGVTRPDQPRGRGLGVAPSPVAVVCARHGVPALKPRALGSREFLSQLTGWAPDYLVVAAYGRILPRAVLDLPRGLPINVHASLLPRLRGAAPIQGALLAGDRQTGVTIMRVVERLDAGPILLQRRLEILPDDTCASLSTRLADLGAQAVLEALEELIAGRLAEMPQDESQATYTALVKKADARIDWTLPAVQIERMVRAYYPWPIAHALLGGEEVRIYGATPLAESYPGDAAPGTVVAVGRELVVRCGEGNLRLLEVQAPGRKRIKGEDFARGRRLVVGQSFDQLPPNSAA